VTASQVELPDGVELSGDPDQVLVHVLAAPTAEQMEAELDAEVAEIPVSEDEAAAEDGDEETATESDDSDAAAEGQQNEQS
jgi:large subunit ribosomal protein L25